MTRIHDGSAGSTRSQRTTADRIRELIRSAARAGAGLDAARERPALLNAVNRNRRIEPEWMRRSSR